MPSVPSTQFSPSSIDNDEPAESVEHAPDAGLQKRELLLLFLLKIEWLWPNNKLEDGKGTNLTGLELLTGGEWEIPRLYIEWGRWQAEM